MAKKNKPETAADRVKQLQNNYVDLTKTGPLTYRELAYLMGDNRPYTPSNSIVAANQPRPILENLINSDKGVQYIQSDYGNSMFDPEGYATEGQLEQLNDIRAENQPWYAQIGAGLAKGVVLAGTTFLDGTLGLILGGAEAIAKGDVSRLWDNDFSRAMQSVNEWSEEVMPNYYSREELEEPWYKNIFTANWLGDKFLKNLGFSVGAIYSGGVYTAGLKALKIPSLIGKVLKSTAAPKIVQSAVGATLSAVNEGRIEALNNSNDWQDLKMQELDDLWGKEINKKYAGTIQSLTDEYYRTLAEFENTGDLNKKAQAMALGAKLQQVQEQASAEFENRNSDQRYRNIAGRIAEDRLKMGNMDLLMNIPILTASNIVQFTKFYARGFNTARKAGVTGSIAEGYAGKEFSKLGAGTAIAKAGLSEGTEEISQKAASLISGNYYSTDVNNYRKSQFDKNASQETLDWTKAFATGINETVNDASSWEEFTIGALTGFMGIPMFRGMKNAEGKAQSPIYLEGGAREAYRNYKKDIERSQEIANYLNSRVQSPEFQNYYRGIVRHNKYQNDMNQAVMDDDEFDYKNAEYAQFVSDINMFDNAGRLQDLKDYISNMYDVSDEELEAIIDKTTSKDADGKSTGPFIDKNGNRLTSTEEGKQEMRDKLTKEKDSMMKTINNYRKTKDNLDSLTGGVLTNDQLSELTWMSTQIDDWNDRVDDMIPLIKRGITDLISNRRQDISQILTDLAKSGVDVSSKSKENTALLARLESLLHMSDKQLKNVLTNPKNKDFVEGLAKQMDIFGSETIGAIDTRSIKNILRDIPRIGEGIKLYNDKLSEYLKSPEKLAEDQAKTDKEAAEAFRQEDKKKFRDKVSSAQSVAEFRTAFEEEEDEDTKNGVLADLIDEGNKVAKNYKEISQYDNELSKALNSLGEDEDVVQDALSLWKEQYDKAENMEQLGNMNSVFINNEQAFLSDSEGDIELADSRFQRARYALQRAMSKVNNDIKFRDRFSKAYREPVNEPVQGKGVDRDETGDSRTPTIPPVNTGPTPTEAAPTPVGNITANEVAAENSDTNRRVETRRSLDQKQQGRRKYYRPSIPELHIEASKEGDFRPFDVVVAEREPGKDFSEIYNYLRDNGAFDYVNSGKLKAGQTLLFMIDPEFEQSVEGKPWHTAPTVFLTTEDGQVVGSLDEGSSIASFEGLEGLVQKVRDEYQASRQSDTVGGSPVALSYLLENGVGTIESAGYFLHAVAAAFPAVTSEIEAIRNSLDKETLGMKPDTFASSNNSAISQIEALVNEYYEEDGVNLYKELLNNSTGFVPAEGNKVGIRLEKLTPIKTKPAKSSRFFATPQTRVSKVMVGRIPYTSEERSLADIPGVIDGDTKPIFGIIKNGVLTTNEKIDDRLIIKPVDMAQKEGRLYLLIPNAAGTYSPVAVRVKHFNKQEFNLDDATVAATSIGKEINSVIDRLADSKDNDDVTKVLKDLNDVLYARDLHIDYFSSPQGEGIRIVKVQRDENGNEVYVTNKEGKKVRVEERSIIYFQSSKSKVEYGGMEFTREVAEKSVKEGTLDPSILDSFGQPRDIADIRKDILNALLRYNLPLQVSASKINDSGYNNRAIKSNILTSNLREAKVIDSWFITDYFDNQGKLQRAISPAPAKPAPRGGGSAVRGTRVVVSGTPYIVDLKSSIAINEKTGEKRAFSAFDSQLLIDMAWAQETFGDATESSMMTENKVITPKGAVLDRNTGKYLTGEEAQRIKDKIAGKDEEAKNRVAKSKKVVAEIYENQKKVDKTRTDSNYYYILEDDGQYHKYDRVHSRLGDNWLGKKTESENSRRALEAGTAVDKVIRDFFTSNTAPVRPDILSEEAFSALISRLTEIKSNMEQMGETFLANNIVLFHKYADGSRVAGEVDILSVDKNGNFKIYDVKTSRYSFSDRYFNEKSSMQRMSTKDYYTLQLSAYQNLFESQYGVRPTRLAILPFVLTHGTTQAAAVDIPSGTQTKLGLPIDSNQSYFRADRKVDDNEARFVSSEKDGKVYFKPILDTKAHEATLRSTDAAKLAVEFIGGDPKEASSFVLVEPGEATRNSENGRLMISKKAKVFAVTPGTPYSSTRNIVTSITHEQGIPITYNPAVNVPLESRASAPVTPSNLPIFDSTIETMNPENRVLPENAFEEGGEIGYYEKDGKLYTGYLKKIGEVEVTYGSGQKDMVPIHVTKVRDRGFGKGLNANSEYLTVFPNGKAISTRTNDTNDNHAAEIIMKALSAKPEKVLSLSNEKTKIHNPRMLEELDAEIRDRNYNSAPQQGGAGNSIQKNDSVNQHDDEFEDDLLLREVDSSTRPTWNKEKGLKWLRKVLPQLSEQDRVKVVEGLIQVAENGPVAWGMFSNGIVTLSDIAAEGTEYHEAFHVVFNLMLTPQEKELLFEEARQMYGNKSYLDLEEDMAEGFREYVMSQEKRSLGRRILDFFKNLFAKVTHWKYMKPSLTAYYQMINQGRYRKYDLSGSSISRLRQEEYTSEMQSIKDKAIADGTFMKAPNGNPTNLNERQWLQVRTKAFKDWFGDWINNPEEASKVVDENGEPLVVYHSSMNKFTTFDSKYKNRYSETTKNGLKKFFYFTSSKVHAEQFSISDEDILAVKLKEYFNNGVEISELAKGYNISEAEVERLLDKQVVDRGITYEVFLNIRNPLRIDAKGESISNLSNEEISSINNSEGSVIENALESIDPDVAQMLELDDILENPFTTDYLVSNPNQIKSATSNTGEFSSNNDDIRFRTVDDNSKVMKRESQRFLDNFGITIKEVEEFGGEEKLFDALNRVINVRNADDISEGVGEAIAFMMQHNDTMETLIKYKLQEVPKSIRRSIRKRGDFNALASTKHLDNEERQKYVKEIGKEIATELRKLYRVEPINVKPKTFLSKLWEIITEFFDKLTPSAKTKFNILRNYTKNIANSVKLNDPSIVLTTDYKPGTTEKAARVDIGKALRENPYERRIIEYLNSKNIALAGSASIALEGTLYRPSENPLHDIDFNAARYSKEELDNVIKEHFPHSTFVREITDGKDKITETYLVIDRPFVTRKPVSGIAGVELYDKETGKKLGSYVGSELFLEKGVQGKFLDFFLGEGNSRYPYKVHNIDGKSYLVSDFRNAFSAKIAWARPKDIWDYNKFNTEEQLDRITERREQEKNRIKEKLESARIIWGHPAIGKTTYLERNQDILEWDQEVNDKRNRFFRDQIDPEHKLDSSSKEYKQLRSQYMSEWREHPEYVKFLTDEWENLKERARRENKRLFASPAPLLEIGADDFDLYVNIPEKSFLERNTRRGGTPLGSMGWKQIVNDALVRVDSDKIVTTDKYFSEFMRDNLGVQWGTLTNEEARKLENKGWTKEQFERVSQPERERAVKCAVL